jgi:hypothetical protein
VAPGVHPEDVREERSAPRPGGVVQQQREIIQPCRRPVHAHQRVIQATAYSSVGEVIHASRKPPIHAH